MNLRFAILCDYSNDSADGKLNLIGLTDTIFAYQFPAIHREAHFVCSFTVEPADFGRQIEVTLQFIDEDGVKLFESKGLVHCQSLKQVLNYRHILHDVRLDRPGTYQFTLFVDGREVAALPLQAQQVERNPN